MAHLHDIALALGKKPLLNKYTFLSNITAIAIKILDRNVYLFSNVIPSALDY
jgi:hypothetical protein